jgi:hypothetical protein
VGACRPPNLGSFLTSLDYEKCLVEQIVMKRLVADKIHVLLLYVDGIMVIADNMELDRFQEAFPKEFKWITTEVSALPWCIENILMGHVNLKMFDTPLNRNVVSRSGKVASGRAENRFT